MKLKTLLAGCLLITNLSFAEPLCTYSAYITATDKSNSSGQSLIQGNNKLSVAAILQQDRADFYSGYSDQEEGEHDCYFYSAQNRKTLAKKLSEGNISQATINRIVNKGGWFTVEIHSTHINVR